MENSLEQEVKTKVDEVKQDLASLTFAENKNENNTKEESWFWHNLARPFLSNMSEAYTTINSVPKLIFGSSPLPDLHIDPSQDQIGLNLNSAAQILSQGLAGAIIYTAAGKIVGATSRWASTNSTFRDFVPNFLCRETGSMIAGAALYDAARAPKEGETRIGNSLSGAVAFGLFIGSHKPINKLANFTSENTGLSLAGTGIKIAALPAVGGVVGVIQKQVATGYSQQRLLDSNEIIESALAGAMMNTLLPGTMHAANLLANKFNQYYDRGMPVERFIKANNFSGATELSRLSKEQAHARVKVDSTKDSSANSSTGEIILASASPIVLAHELGHLRGKNNESIKLAYKETATLIQQGKLKEAKAKFIETRIEEERIAYETSKKIAPVTAEFRPSAISTDPRYIALWEKQFEIFLATDGKILPNFDLLPANDSSSSTSHATSRLTYTEQALKELPSWLGDRLPAKDIVEAQNFSSLDQARNFLKIWQLYFHEYNKFEAPSKVAEFKALADSPIINYPEELITRLCYQKNMAEIIALKPSEEHLKQLLHVFRYAPDLAVNEFSITLAKENLPAWKLIATNLAHEQLKQELSAETVPKEALVKRSQELIDKGPETVFYLAETPLLPILEHYHGSKLTTFEELNAMGNIYATAISSTKRFGEKEARQEVGSNIAHLNLERYNAVLKELETRIAISESWQASNKEKDTSLGFSNRENSQYAAIKISSIFRDRWPEFFQMLENKNWSLKNAMESFLLSGKERSEGLADFILANQNLSVTDLSRIASTWPFMVKNPEFSKTKNDPKKVELAALQELAKTRFREEAHEFETEISMYKIAANLSGPYRRLLIQMKTQIEKQKDNYPRLPNFDNFNQTTFDSVLNRFGFNTERLSKEKEQNVAKELISRGVAYKALNIAQAFKTDSMAWLDAHNRLGRSALEAAATLPIFWSKIHDTHRVFDHKTKTEITLAEWLKNNVSVSVAKQAEVSYQWLNTTSIDSTNSNNIKVELKAKDANEKSGLDFRPHPVYGNWWNPLRVMSSIEHQLPIRDQSLKPTDRTEAKADLVYKIADVFDSTFTALPSYIQLARLLDRISYDPKSLEREYLASNNYEKLADKKHELSEMAKIINESPEVINDPQAWVYFKELPGLSISDRELILKNWHKLADLAKDTLSIPNIELARKASLLPDKSMPQELFKQVIASIEADWHLLAAKKAWSEAAEQARHEINQREARQRDIYKDRDSKEKAILDLTQNKFEQKYSQLLQAGLEKLINERATEIEALALSQTHLNAAERIILAQALELEKAKSSNFNLYQSAKEIDSKIFFYNLSLMEYVIEGKSTDSLMRARHNNSEIQGALGLTYTFGHKGKQWLEIQKKLDNSAHDATHFLPNENTPDSKQLGQYLLKYVTHPLERLENVARLWSKAAESDRQLNPNDLLSKVSLDSYKSLGEIKHESFAKEAGRWGVEASDYHSYESRFLDSLKTPSPFPVDRIWEFPGSIKAYFLRRDDPRGLFLGNHTNCCQHPEHSQGSSAAWYGQESKNAGFFVLENAKGQIIAMSLAIETKTVDGKKLLFDNVESKGLGRDEGAALALYQKAADSLIKEHDYTQINLGTANGDITTKHWQKAPDNQLLSMPSDHVDVYSDATKGQVIIADRTEISTLGTSKKLDLGFEDQIKTSSVKIRDIETIESWSRARNPQRKTNLAFSDTNILLQKGDEIIGFASLSNNRILKEFIFPENNKQNTEILFAEILRQISRTNEAWQAEFNDTRSLEIFMNNNGKQINGRKLVLTNQDAEPLKNPSDLSNYIDPSKKGKDTTYRIFFIVD